MRVGGPRLSPKTGLILYEGESALDGGPVFVAATFGTDNAKTGDLIQTWIMRSDMHPIEASRTGADESICGNCPHKAVNNGRRSCYVNLVFGPRGVWDAYQNGKYVPYDDNVHRRYFDGQLLRVGAYGDPVAIPLEVWTPFIDMSFQATSYTHLWRLACAQPFKEWTMASVDGPLERKEARELGWRTYRVDGGDGLGEQEIWCPATTPGGNRALCETCMACDGHMRGSKRVDIASPVHGSGSSHFMQWAGTKELERQGIKQLELFDDI